VSRMKRNCSIVEKYYELFEKNMEFKKVYTEERIKLYRHIVDILLMLNVTSVLDVGCAFGLFVDLANKCGIDAYGLDLPIDELKTFHESLSLSRGKFIYGSIEDNSIIDQIAEKQFQTIVLLDTLRYITHINWVSRLNPQFIIIKEVNNNFVMRYTRKNQFDVRLYSIFDLLKLFPSYKIFYLYSSKYIFALKNPSLPVILTIGRLLPTYTAILERKV